MLINGGDGNETGVDHLQNVFVLEIRIGLQKLEMLEAHFLM